MSKEKIAILGSGVGSITAAYYLSSTPELRDRYDVTVYQQGWRWGGKGASGRNASDHERIEEHGLHVWMGFYENAFHSMRACYSELKREQGPIQTVADAFKPHDYIVLMDQLENQEWKPWKMNFPRLPGLPGEGHDPGGLEEILEKFIEHTIEKGISRLGLHFKQKQQHFTKHTPSSFFKEALEGLGHQIEHFALDSLDAWSTLIQSITKALIKAGRAFENELKWLGHILESFVEWIEKHIAKDLQDNTTLREIWFMLDFGCSVIKGFLSEHVLTRGLSVLDRYDFREFLKKYGASDFTQNAPPIRGFYDLAFGYEGGDVERPNMAAGVFMRSALRMTLTYKGAIFWKMQAGMGDIVFAPYYQLLKKRGVKMAFFHQVKALRCDDHRISSIEMEQQVQLKQGALNYEPLVDILGVPSWPSQALYNQINETQAEKLKTEQVNLESFYSQWDGGTPIELKEGVDFDQVILGISVAGFPFIAKDLISADSQFAKMVESQKTTQTQAMQLWLKPDLQELGWNVPSPILDAYVEPMNTWADMTQVLCRETWPTSPDSPQNIAYFCGPLKGPDDPLPPIPENKNLPKTSLEEVKAVCIDLLENHMKPLWPNAVDEQGQFTWDLLTGDGDGQARLNHQYCRANIDPSERYVLSPKGQTQFRLSAKGTLFGNLVLAGDWTKNGLNVGCVEAATISGMLASQAVCGTPNKIYGHYDL